MIDGNDGGIELRVAGHEHDGDIQIVPPHFGQQLDQSIPGIMMSLTMASLGVTDCLSKARAPRARSVVKTLKLARRRALQCASRTIASSSTTIQRGSGQ